MTTGCLVLSEQWETTRERPSTPASASSSSTPTTHQFGKPCLGRPLNSAGAVICFRFPADSPVVKCLRASACQALVRARRCRVGNLQEGYKEREFSFEQRAAG